MFLNLIFGSFALFVVIVIAALIVRQAKPRKSDLMFDLRTFEPQELDRLKAKGLLSEEEAKKVQAVVAERAVEWSEQQRREKETAPVDINTLLAEAENYRRHFEKSRSNEKGSPPEEPEE